MRDTLNRYRPEALGVFRVVVALLFIAHGTQKLFGFPAPADATGSGDLGTLMLVAGLLETFGGLMILVGFFTRPVAFVLSGMMAVAYFMAHAPQDFFPVNNQGDAAILYCFAFLYFVFAGPGAFAVDNVAPLDDRRRAQAPRDYTLPSTRTK
ncbi:MAG: DoxX family protein [Rhizobiaceae bacterium]|nr:DoxX family protein [Rhizobiaceae bacterium]